MLDKYGVGQDPYCYPGRSVLRNRLYWHDEALLHQAERELSEIDAVACDYQALEAIFERCISKPAAT